MNKNKISPLLTSEVTTLNNSKFDVFIYSSNYYKTKQFLKQNNFSFKTYRFVNSFLLNIDYTDLGLLSSLEDVNYIFSNSEVQALKKEANFMNIDKLTENKYFGQGQTICFIDTGIYPHFDFIFPSNRIVKFVDLVNKKNFPYDDNGHGTFVSGIACGCGIYNQENCGFAKHAKIITIKALNSKGSSSSNLILDAMEWIYQNHKVYNITVVCMSFGADCLNKTDPLSKGAELLWKSGITIVSAAGNSGPNNNTIKSPGNNPYIITVGALDIDKMQISNFSSRGPTIYGHKPDLLAPAVNITSCNNKALPYTIMSGTSVATPIIAGICAIIKSKYPQLSNYEIKKFLLSNCRKLTGNVDFEGAGYLIF